MDGARSGCVVERVLGGKGTVPCQSSTSSNRPYPPPRPCCTATRPREPQHLLDVPEPKHCLELREGGRLRMRRDQRRQAALQRAAARAAQGRARHYDGEDAVEEVLQRVCSAYVGQGGGGLSLIVTRQPWTRSPPLLQPDEAPVTQQAHPSQLSSSGGVGAGEDDGDQQTACVEDSAVQPQPDVVDPFGVVRRLMECGCAMSARDAAEEQGCRPEQSGALHTSPIAPGPHLLRSSRCK